MSDKKDDIKELFQKELGNYKAKVDPSLWNGIQAGISSAGATAGAGTTFGLAGKIVIGTAVAAAVTVGTIFYVNKSDDTSKKEENTTIKIADSITEENLNQEIKASTLQKENELNANVNSSSKQGETKANNEVVENKIRPKEQENQQDNHITFVQESNHKTKDNSNDNKSANSAATANEKEKQAVPKNSVDESLSIVDEDNSATSPQNQVEKARQEENKVSELTTVEAQVLKQNNQYVTFSVENVPQDSYVVWDFGDGTIERTMNPEHFYAEAGTYEVKCIVNSNNEEIIKSLQVEVNIVGEIGDLPNVFTPNGDGRNDEFFINSKNLKIFQLTVIDNQQKIIYSTNDASFRWNGTDKTGKPVKEGTYYYIIVAEDESGNTINKYQQLRLKR